MTGCESSLTPTATIYPAMQNVTAVSELLKPFDARLMRCYPGSTRINSVVNEDQECSRPVDITEPQNQLFI